MYWSGNHTKPSRSSELLVVSTYICTVSMEISAIRYGVPVSIARFQKVFFDYCAGQNRVRLPVSEQNHL
jgi:hypothetical protein